MNNDAIIIANT